jgi:putative nucleotidyltransferase with HDIG domain
LIERLEFMPGIPKSDSILIVDDDPAVRSILMRSLDDYPNRVETHSPFDAINKLKNDRYSLLISDVMMPGMPGTELLQLARKNDPDVAVIMITGMLDVGIAVNSIRLGAYDFITKPFEISVIKMSVKRALEKRRLLLENRTYQAELESMVRERTKELKNALNEVEESYKITLEALVAALDAREHETQAHSHRVQEYTITLAKLVGIDGEELIQVGRGALLHDVGKIGIPDSILLKPGKLTEDEWVEMKKHPQVGFEILESIRFLAPAAELVLSHQEKWDGKGYPRGLADSEIPLGARVFAVADSMDAITSDRPYRKAMTFDYAVEEIRRCSGSQFDPRAVEAFLSLSPEAWKEIHDNVNLVRQGQDFNMLCRI